jgi:hypothetical protein
VVLGVGLDDLIYECLILHRVYAFEDSLQGLGYGESKSPFFVIEVALNHGKQMFFCIFFS